MAQTSFYEILEQVQAYLSKDYSALLNAENHLELLQSYVDYYLRTHEIALEGSTTEQLRERLLQEMTGYSFLTNYLAREDVEELNVNSWQDIKVSYANGEILPTAERFRSPQHAVDVIRRMLRESNMIWDNAQPIQVGHLPGNIRITVVGFDVTDPEKALAVSIRKVNSRKLTKEDFVRQGTATDEMLELLCQFYTHGVSMCLTGATGSGKTTLLSWVLSNIPYNKRLLTIEQGTREFDCTVRDENGNVLNNVVHLSTRQSEDERQNITQIKLLELIMTMNPDFIAVGESKGEEANQTVNAANTGHGVITTTHANSCEDTYYRFISLCKLKLPNMDETLLKTLVVRAFPIVGYIKKMSDNKRRLMQITEAHCTADGTIQCHTLFRYVVEKTITVNGRAEIQGHFERVEPPGKALKQRLLDNGLENEYIEQFFRRDV